MDNTNIKTWFITNKVKYYHVFDNLMYHNYKTEDAFYMTLMQMLNDYSKHKEMFDDGVITTTNNAISNFSKLSFCIGNWADTLTIEEINRIGD